MHHIDLDASSWTSDLEIYDAIICALGGDGPPWYAQNINALIDAIVYEQLDHVKPPYVIRFSGLANAPSNVREEIKLICETISEARKDRLELHGEEVEVSVECDV